MGTGVLSRIRRAGFAEYNRCVPCTAIGVALILGLAGLVTTGSPRWSVAITVGGLTVIYLRAYPVAERAKLRHGSWPRPNRGPFDAIWTAISDDADGDCEAAGHTRPLEPAEALLAEGVLERGSRASLRPTDEFATVWWRRIRQVRDETTAKQRLALHLAVDPERIDGHRHDGQFVVTYDGERILDWPSKAAFLADLAAAPTLIEWLSDWETLDDGIRCEMLADIRATLDQCPRCGGNLDRPTDSSRSCRTGNSSNDPVACRECGDRLIKSAPG